MTREEAIKIIDCYDIGFYDLSGAKIPADKLADAFDMAIEALQADKWEWIKHVDELSATNTEKSSNCGDLISREALCQYALNQKDKSVTPNDIMRFPSADRSSGEWKEMEILCNPYPPLFCVECSECGYRVGRETYLDLENTFNFCPNCGAYMRKKNNEQR